MPRRGNRRDHSGKSGNPTNALQQAYRQLMTIEDGEELKDAVLKIVQPLVGVGFSETNYQKFLRNVESSLSSGGTEELRKYITYYILAGSGMAVGEDIQDSIASLMCEDQTSMIPLTPKQRELKLLVESYGYNVILVAQPD